MKGMILTAGLGTRLAPLTDNKPKALVKVGGYTMLEICINYLRKHGINEIIINVHHYADQLVEYVRQNSWEGVRIEISDETDELMNTGGGLQKAFWFFNDNSNFVLMAVDILTDLNLSAMIAQHKSKNALATLAVKKRKTSRDLLFDTEGQLAGWQHNSTLETKTVAGRSGANGFGFSGIHVLNSRIFDLITEEGVFSIIDMYLRLAEKERIQSFEHSEGSWLEFGKPQNIEDAVKQESFKKIITELGL